MELAISEIARELQGWTSSQQQYGFVRPTITTSPLSQEARDIWESFLEVSWRGADVHHYYGEAWPEPVSRQLHALVGAHVFDEFELRTKYNQRAIMGIRNGKSWFIARWTTYGSFIPWADVVGSAKEKAEGYAGNCRFFAFCLVTLGLFMLLPEVFVRIVAPVLDPRDSITGYAIFSGFCFLSGIACWMDGKDYLWKAVRSVTNDKCEHA